MHRHAPDDNFVSRARQPVRRKSTLDGQTKEEELVESNSHRTPLPVIGRLRSPEASPFLLPGGRRQAARDAHGDFRHDLSTRGNVYQW